MTAYTQHRFHVLDGIRGIAALVVMIFHFTTHKDLWLFKNAPVAVDLFFMLSGFVLCFSYGERMTKFGMSLPDFIIRRVIRLYPMFVLGLFMGSVALFLMAKFGQTAYSHHQIIAGFGFNALFVPYMNQTGMHIFERAFESIGSIFPANGPSWSLFFEMFVNFFFLQFAFQTEKSLVSTAMIAFMAMLVLGFLSAFSYYSYRFDAEVGWETTNFIGGFPRVVFGFAVGILIQKIIATRPAQDAGGGALLIRFLAAHPILLYGGTLAMFLIPFNLRGLTFLFSVLVLCPLVVFAGALAKVENRFLLKLSEFLGWISYPVYCLHVPVGNLVAMLNNEGGLSRILPVPFALSASVMSVFVAVVMTRFYEEPMRAFLTRRAKALGKNA